MGYFDRLDYVSMIVQEFVFARAVELISGLPINNLDFILRIIHIEITRILNHLLAITTHALDVGAMTPFLWAFEEREKLMSFYERSAGARMHAILVRPGGFTKSIPSNFFLDLANWLNSFSSRIDEIEDLLNENRIWKRRLINIGIVKAEFAMDLGFSGVLLRGSGIGWDLRNTDNLKTGYDLFSLLVPIGTVGDCYDRYLIRIFELRTSIKLLVDATDYFLSNVNNNYEIDDFKYSFPPKSLMKLSMESLIDHFKYFSENLTLPSGKLYTCLEAPKGEFGVLLVTMDDNKLNRCYIRSPGFFHLEGIEFLMGDGLIADLATIIGTLDLVFGEIDR